MIYVFGEGKVRFFIVNSINDVVFNLYKVLFVLKLIKNLFLVFVMVLMGVEICFDKDKCLVFKDGKEFVIGCLLYDKLYFVNFNEYV